MSKSATRNPLVKRRLQDQFETSNSTVNTGNKRRREENQNSEPLARNGGVAAGKQKKSFATKFVKEKAENEELVVKLATRSNTRKVVSKEKPKQQIKSKIVVPITSAIRASARVIKPPARFLENDLQKLKPQRMAGKKPKEKCKQPHRVKTRYDSNDKQNRHDLTDIELIDSQTSSEIIDGNAVADNVDHDGVELSIHGSDIDDFSDEETRRDEQEGHESGEIVSSEDESSAQAVPARNKQNKLEKFQHWKNDPDFGEFIDGILDKKLSGKIATATATTSKATEKGGQGNSLIKSPSDTTLYSPGLRRANVDTHVNLAAIANDNESDLIEKISNFVEHIRIGNRQSYARGSSQATGSGDNNKNTPLDKRRVEHRADRDKDISSPDRTQQATDQLLLQAEKFKARVEAPKGTYLASSSNNTGNLMPYDYDKLREKFITNEGLGPIDSEILFLRNFDQDDEFFHVTSQIDPSLKSKIERGEFIDLERLLPKDKFGNRGHDELNKQLYQLITQGTNTYMSSSLDQRGNRINNIRKWDQAFRVFAAIYTQANPSRAGEIWQYVYVIHTAATSNPWENVAYYDITFRELMASKPWRNWGKTYTQGWNMAFHNGSTHGSAMVASTSSNRSSNSNGQGQNGHSWKDDCCWRYNKNKCKRTSNECRYDHRCTHCAGWFHSWNNCRKRLGRQSGNGNKSGNWDSFNKSNKPP